MPRVYHLKAAKDYPSIGVKKGEFYYKWKMRYGPTQRSKTPPRPTQTSNAKTARIREAIEDANLDDCTTPDEVTQAVQTVGETAREVADEYQEALDAWPSGNSQIEEMMQAASDFADECEGFEADEGDWADADTLFEDSDECKTAKEEWLAEEPEEGQPARKAEDWKEGLDAYDEAKQEYDDEMQDKKDEVMQNCRSAAEDVFSNASF